jgi:hypothetical protein
MPVFFVKFVEDLVGLVVARRIQVEDRRVSGQDGATRKRNGDHQGMDAEHAGSYRSHGNIIANDSHLVNIAPSSTPRGLTTMIDIKHLRHPKL